MAGNLEVGNNNKNFKWVSWVPNKNNFLVQRILCNRILVAVNHVAKGIVVSTIFYLFCNSEDEVVDHIFSNALLPIRFGHCLSPGVV